MRVVVTGGAGFIGSNVARYYLDKGDDVVILDNLSRAGSTKNLDWLASKGKHLIVIIGDIRRSEDIEKCKKYIRDADAVIHLAAQVAVTTSVQNPHEDFEINALGTLNILECMRASQSEALFIYASTNKVYGAMENISVIEEETRYSYKNLHHGIPESQNLDFHSPYGCSKGAADQYVHDYNRIYGIDTVVFRQSCIYGPRQFGVEDQGWVAWFIIAIMFGKALTIFGNGKQVRDVLYIDDLIAAYDLAIQKRKETKGKIYNIGGGPGITLSVWNEFGPILERLYGKRINIQYSDWRPGDQPVYVSDIRKARKEFGWGPTVGVQQGVAKLYHWISANKTLFAS